MFEVWSRRWIISGEECEIDSFEYVEVKVFFFYLSRRGNLILFLEFFIGIKLYFMIYRFWDLIKYFDFGFGIWYFLFVYFWGEKMDGIWKLIVKIDDEYFIKGK